MGYQQLLGGAKFCNSDDFWILGERLVQVLLQAEATKWLALTPVETTGGLVSLTSGSSSGVAGGAASFIAGLSLFSAGSVSTLQSTHGIVQPEAQ